MRKARPVPSIQQKAIRSTKNQLLRNFGVITRLKEVPFLEPSTNTPPRALLSWTRHLRTSSSGTNGAGRDIIVDNLLATIEAHRATNTQKLIHKRIARSGCNSFKRIAVQPRTADESNGDIIAFAPKAHHAIRLPIRKVPTEERALPTPNFRDAGDLERPWLDHLQDQNGDVRERLRNEMKAFEMYMMPTLAETTATQRVIKEITTTINAVLPSNPISIHGSRYTGLAGPLSDIDFKLALPEFEKDPLVRGPSSTRPQACKAGMRILWRLHKLLKRDNMYTSVSLIQCKKPIVSAINCETGLSVQFIALSPTTSSEFTINYLIEFPGLRPLFILLRHSLKIRNLTTVNHGGIGSYALLILIVVALKHTSRVFASDDLAGQLLHVLDFYAEVDLRRYGLCADPPCIFAKDSKSSAHLFIQSIIMRDASRTSNSLCLQDPASPATDLGKPTLLIKDIQAVFNEARQNIRIEMKIWESLDRQARRKWDRGLLDPFVRANYDQFEISRRKLAAFSS